MHAPPRVQATHTPPIHSPVETQASPRVLPHVIPPGNTPLKRIPLRRSRVHLTQHFADSEVPFQSPEHGHHLHVIEDHDPIPARYYLWSQVNCTLESKPLSPPLANVVIEGTTGSVLKYKHLIRDPDKQIWTTSCANGYGQLVQGVGTRMPNGTNTIFFIPFGAVRKDRKVLYVKPVATIRPNKAEVNRVRLTAGGDKMEYPGVTATPRLKYT